MRNTARIIAIVIASFVSSGLAQPRLLVVNQADATLSLIDPATNRQVAVIAENVPRMVGHEVAVSPDHRLAYVPLYGDSGVGRPGSDGDRILVIDLATQKIVRQIVFPHGVRPHCMVYSAANGLFYVTTEVDQSVAIIDAKTFAIVGSISTGQEQSHMLALTPDGRKGYTANVGPGTVSVLDLGHRKLVKTISIAPTTQRIVSSNDGHWIFTSDQTKPRMAVIDTTSDTITRWIDLPAPGYGSASTKDGKLLLVTLPTANSMAVVDLKTYSVLKTIEIGPHPQEVLVRPDGRFAYVSCFGGDQVAVVDLSTMRVTTLAGAGNKADGMAWAGN
jgi:YVTN family beta-propeller protein